MNGTDDREIPRGRSFLLWPLRFLLHLLIKIVVLAVLGIRFVLRPKPVRFALVALAVAGIAAWNFFGGMIQEPAQVAGARTSAVVSTQAATQLSQPEVVERYLRAQANFDAEGMWDTIADSLKQQMSASNITPDQLQAELDAARQQGRRYRGATYVGGTPISGGQSVYFYILTVDTPRGTSDIPYIYIVGPDGKISSIQ